MMNCSPGLFRRHADLILLGLLLLLMMVLHLFVDVPDPRAAGFLRSGVGVGKKPLLVTKVAADTRSLMSQKFGGNMVYQCHFHQCHSADLFRTVSIYSTFVRSVC